jgi:4-hydroxybenzoate polyprenyltransferase
MFMAIIKTMRPRQWFKNIFIMAALIFDRQLTHPQALIRCSVGFLLFCMLSGAVYIINDIADINADRLHPKKKNRPIASGKLSVPTAITAAIVIMAFTLPSAFWLSTGFGIIAVSFFLLNLAYSKWLKHIPIIDVMMIATDFLLRVAAGVALIQVERFSPWLYVVTSLLALYIGFGKRRAELMLLSTNAEKHRPVLDGYSIPFLDQLITIVSGATIISYSFYTFSAPNLPSNHSMMLTIPFVVYGIFRWLYLIHIKKEGGAPEEMVLSDRPLQATVLLYGLSVIAVFYVFYNF